MIRHLLTLGRGNPAIGAGVDSGAMPTDAVLYTYAGSGASILARRLVASGA